MHGGMRVFPVIVSFRLNMFQIASCSGGTMPRFHRPAGHVCERTRPLGLHTVSLRILVSMMGMIACFHVPAPVTGSHPSCTEKSMIINRAIQKLGTLRPAVVATSTAVSTAVPRFTAAITPLVTPSRVLSTTAPMVSTTVFGRR